MNIGKDLRALKRDCFNWNKKHEYTNWNVQVTKFMIKTAEFLDEAGNYINDGSDESLDRMKDKLGDCLFVLNSLAFIDGTENNIKIMPIVANKTIKLADAFKALNRKDEEWYYYCYNMLVSSTCGFLDNVDGYDLLDAALDKNLDRDRGKKCIKM